MRYQLLRADLWRVAFNYEAIAATTSNVELTELRVDGEFRTTGDYIGLIFNSVDDWAHQYSRYNTKTDYSNVKLECQVEYDGYVARFNNYNLSPSLTITYNDFNVEYVTVGFLGTKRQGSATGIYDGEIELPNAWIIVGSVKVGYRLSETSDWNWSTKVGDDYDIDYTRGRLFTSEMSVIPSSAEILITYTYSDWIDNNTLTLDFNNMYSGTHHSDYKKISNKNIKSIAFPIIPPDYIEGKKEMYGDSREFGVRLYNYRVSGGLLNNEPKNKDPHGYEVAEGYDDEYDKNPARLINMMKQLGYTKDVNFYIGASHFYIKSGEKGKIAHDHHDMVLDPTKSINRAFKVWLKRYVEEMKRLNFERIIISVSMECLQMPKDWRQQMWNGEYGATGWDPPTNFYSPTNTDIQKYIRVITKDILDISLASGLTVDLQLGESWWWWQEFAPGDVNQSYEGQPPCFYDRATKERFRKEMGYNLPIYKNSYIDTTDENWEVAKKLMQYLGEYTIFMKKIAEEYDDVKFTTLFFPPSVLDPERVPEMIRYINYPIDYWEYPNLDYIQIEDYDWVTTDNELHDQVYSFAYVDMGYEFQKQHYFSGFVLQPENAKEEWKLIERAAQQAKGRDYETIFIWAGTQIRRDDWMPLEHTVIPDSARFDTIDKVEKG